MVARARAVPSSQYGPGEQACPVGLRMYVEFFGFRELPFNNTPDPRFFFSTPDHEEALASLIYAVKERKGFVLLTGEVGAGKTLVTRMMLRHFGTHLAFANINHAVQSPEDLMESICTEFELPVTSPTSATQLVRTFHDYLLAQFAQENGAAGWPHRMGSIVSRAASYGRTPNSRCSQSSRRSTSPASSSGLRPITSYWI